MAAMFFHDHVLVFVGYTDRSYASWNFETCEGRVYVRKGEQDVEGTIRRGVAKLKEIQDANRIAERSTTTMEKTEAPA